MIPYSWHRGAGDPYVGNNLQGYWTMDDNTNNTTIINSVNRDYDGYLSNDNNSSDHSVNGVVNKAIHLSYTDNVSISDASSIYSSSQFSIAFWYKMDANHTVGNWDQYLMTKNDASTNNDGWYMICYAGNNNLSFVSCVVGSTGGACGYGGWTSDIKTEWNHYCFIFDTNETYGNRVKFYLNGTTPSWWGVWFDAMTTINYTSSYPLKFNNNMAGSYDEIRYYNEILAPNQVATLCGPGGYKYGR